MKRKKTEEAPAKFWPVPGVDGEPYPPLVQEALDLVEKETLRRKRLECKHETRIFVCATSYDYGRTLRYQRACRDCHAPLDCEHPENALRLQRVQHTGSGSFLEFWECECGELIARRVPEPARQTGTDWLKTAEEERREQKRVRTPNYGFPYERCEPPAGLLPLTVTASVPKNEPGAFESVVFRALQKDMERMKAALQEAKRYKYGGPVGKVPGALTLRNMAGDVVLEPEEEDDWYSHESDMSWIRTNGRMQL